MVFCRICFILLLSISINVLSQEFILYNVKYKKKIFNLNKIKENHIYIFKNHITCISCYKRIVEYSIKNKLKIVYISTASKDKSYKYNIIRELKKITPIRFKILFEISESRDNIYVNKANDNGIFNYLKITKTPYVLLKKNNKIVNFSYEDIFIDNKLEN